MKAYVLITKDTYGAETVSVHWSNTECSKRIIALANSKLTDGSHVDSLGFALRALDNLGIDVATHPVEIGELPKVARPTGGCGIARPA